MSEGVEQVVQPFSFEQSNTFSKSGYSALLTVPSFCFLTDDVFVLKRGACDVAEGRVTFIEPSF